MADNNLFFKVLAELRPLVENWNLVLASFLSFLLQNNQLSVICIAYNAEVGINYVLWLGLVTENNKPRCYSLHLENLRHFLKNIFSQVWVWFDLVIYQVSTFYYVWSWTKSLLWWWVGGGVESNFSVHLWSKTRTLTSTKAQAEQ